MALTATLRHLFHPQRSNNHRPRVLHPEVLVFFIGLTSLFSLLLISAPRLNSTAGSVLGYSSSITASDVITQTNQERERAGLPALIVNRQLSEAAQAKGMHMFANQYWAHTAPDGTQPWSFFKQFKYSYSVAGENLARDFANTPDMLKAWMNSPTHRANIVNQKYKEIGIAVIDGQLNGVETTLVVQFFGTPIAAVPQVNTVAAVQGVQSNLDLQPSPKDTLAQGQADVNLETLTIEQQVPVETSDENGAAVLSSQNLPISQLQTPPLFSPLQLTKAFFLAIILIVVSTLVYDAFIMQNKQTSRMVGKNFAHICFFFVVAFLLIYFKSGAIN
jgi:uncharacterized protein YkwD